MYYVDLHSNRCNYLLTLLFIAQYNKLVFRLESFIMIIEIPYIYNNSTRNIIIFFKIYFQHLNNINEMCFIRCVFILIDSITKNASWKLICFIPIEKIKQQKNTTTCCYSEEEQGQEQNGVIKFQTRLTTIQSSDAQHSREP